MTGFSPIPQHWGKYCVLIYTIDLCFERKVLRPVLYVLVLMENTTQEAQRREAEKNRVAASSTGFQA
jgi:hypothetical protein